MATLPTRAFRAEPPELVCRPSEEGSDEAELTFFEPDRDPSERTTRWITANVSDCLPEEDWR